MANEEKGAKGPPDKDVVIHIDHKQYKVSEEIMNGSQIRATAKPPISGDYDLYLENPGPGDDQKVGDLQQLALKNGMQFYSVPREINPGVTGHGIA